MFGILIGLIIPGGAQWHAHRFWAGLTYLGCAVTIGLFAYPRFGWPPLLLVPVLALIEQWAWHLARQSARGRGVT
ncbi:MULTISPECIES: hypothetical protein [unclassified Crossiella]|uniref:hypothetical protein n=1 Tax=unclassified Crossiella TaxID=2620835 RepID=UPI0020004DF3|nr:MULTISPECIES: hypothetical protein [unclassified Crossiella]MCK2240682.1 hypothetical protein [Crossiella sp. S99.2]MCK2252867.1 hypothetical protein [Crossiella sp. S99.1]